MAQNEDKADGGYASRKLVFSVGVAGAIFVAGILCVYMPALAPNYPAMIGGMLGALGIYAGANVGNKYLVNKTASQQQQSQDLQVTDTEGENC